MAPKSVTFRRHDHLVSVLFGDLLSHSYNITFSMFLYLVTVVFADFACHSYQHNILEMFLYLVHLFFWLYKWARPSAYTLAVARNSQIIIIANLPKYAVHGIGATKPPAPESPRTASLKPMLVLCLATIPYC